jgi:integrase
LQARPVELWLRELPISPKSRVHVRGLVRALWDYAMWRGEIPTQRNPMELVTIKGATKRARQPRSLTVEELQKLVRELEEPVRTIALVCVCFGLRISECLGLNWSDVDWLDGTLRVERSIVRQRVGDVKTIYSGRVMSIDAEMLAVLKAWKQTTQFAAELDWIFASPVQQSNSVAYRSPIPGYGRCSRRPVPEPGSEHWGHTRSVTAIDLGWTPWELPLPCSKSSCGMRTSELRSNIYGDVVTNEMAQAHSKVVRLAIPKPS